MRFAASMVTSVPFFMRIEDIGQKANKETLGEHKSSPPSAQLFSWKPYFDAALAFDGSGSSRTGIPSFTFNSRSIRLSNSLFSRNADLEFSRPWPSRSPL